MVQLFLSCIITGSIMSFVGLTMLVCLLVKGWRTKTLSQFKAIYCILANITFVWLC